MSDTSSLPLITSSSDLTGISKEKKHINWIKVIIVLAIILVIVGIFIAIVYYYVYVSPANVFDQVQIPTPPPRNQI